MKVCEKPFHFLSKSVSRYSESSVDATEEERPVHPDLLESKLKNTYCNLKAKAGDLEDPSISSDEETPNLAVPVQTEYIQNPARTFISNLSNNRWMKRQAKSGMLERRSLYPVSISLAKSNVPPKAKIQRTEGQPKQSVKVVSFDLYKKSLSSQSQEKRTINLVDHIKGTKPSVFNK